MNYVWYHFCFVNQILNFDFQTSDNKTLMNVNTKFERCENPKIRHFARILNDRPEIFKYAKYERVFLGQNALPDGVCGQKKRSSGTLILEILESEKGLF